MPPTAVTLDQHLSAIFNLSEPANHSLGARCRECRYEACSVVTIVCDAELRMGVGVPVAHASVAGGKR